MDENGEPTRNCVKCEVVPNTDPDAETDEQGNLLEPMVETQPDPATKNRLCVIKCKQGYHYDRVDKRFLFFFIPRTNHSGIMKFFNRVVSIFSHI